MKVPLLDLHAQHAPFRAAIVGAVPRVFDAQQFIMIPEVQRLEEALSRALPMYPGLTHDRRQHVAPCRELLQ